MPAAVTSALKVRYRKESTFGTAPGGTYEELRITGEDLAPQLTFEASEVIRNDGQIDNIIQTDAEGGGPVNGELAWQEWDDWMEYVLLAGTTWTASPVSVTATTIAAVAPAGTVPGQFTDTGNGLGSFTDGMWVKVTGFTGGGTNANDVWKVVNAAAGALHVVGKTLVADAAGESVTITQLAQVVNGKTVSTVAFELEDSDDTDEFRQYLGAAANTFGITVPTQGRITTTMELISKVPSSQATSDASANNAAPTSEPMTAKDVLRVLEGNPEINEIADNALEWDRGNAKLLDFSLSITPSLRTRKAIGSTGPAIVHGRGSMLVTGNIRLYYNNTTGEDDKVLWNKVVNNTVTGLALVVRDGNLNGYIIDLPRIKYTGGSRTNPGQSQDVILDLSFQAYRNPDDTNIETDVDGVTIRICRGAFPA